MRRKMDASKSRPSALPINPVCATLVTATSVATNQPVRGAMHVTTEDAWTGFRGKLFAYIRARARTTEDAEDILQDVFLKVHRRIGTLQDQDRLGPWLYRMTHNTIVDFYRRRKPTPAPLDPPELVEEDIPIAERRLAPFLRDLIEELPDRYRQALTLAELEGLTQAEMALRLGLSTSGAKSRVQRGRNMLRDQLLACCHIELDGRGHVVDYESRNSGQWPESCPCAVERDTRRTQLAIR